MMMRLALIAFAAAPIGEGRPTRPAMTWIYIASASARDDATLAYGVEGTESGKAILRCRPGSGRIVVSTRRDFAPRGGKLRLGSGSSAAWLSSHTEPDEASDGYLVQATVSARDPVAQAFRRGAKLSVSIGGDRTTLPAAPKAMTAAFFKSCA